MPHIIRFIPFLLSLLLLFPFSASAQAPYAHTMEAWRVRQDQDGSTYTATLAGMATANAAVAATRRAFFRWRERGVGSWNQTAPLTVTAGNNVTYVTQLVTGLGANKVFEYYIVVDNTLSAPVSGATKLFVTGKKISVFGDVAGDGQPGQVIIPLPSDEIMRSAIRISAAPDKAYLIRPAGNLSIWGYDLYTSGTVPPSAINIVQAGGGVNHSLALKEDQIPVACGHNSHGQISMFGISTAISVSAGNLHSTILLANGSLVVKGGGTEELRTIPSTAQTNVVEIAAALGGDHNLALRADGTVVGWGANTIGQINIPSTIAVGANSRPDFSPAIAVAAGTNHSLALLANGTVLAWGSNADGQSTVTAGLSGVMAIAAGGKHSLALKSDGTVVSWGASNKRQRGFPGALDRTYAIAAGGEFSLIMSDFNQPAEALPMNLNLASSNFDNVVTLQGRDPNYDSLRFKITTPPSLGRLFQYGTNGQRGDQIVAQNTDVSDVNDRVIFVADYHGQGAAYTTFRFSASDGIQADYSASATATVNIKNWRTSYTRSPYRITGTSAMFVGAVYPNGFKQRAWFEWGEFGRYTDSTPPRVLVDQAKLAEFSEQEFRLLAGRMYQVRIVLQQRNDTDTGWGETIYGWPNVFTTGGRVVSGVPGGATLPPAGLALGSVVAISSGTYHHLALNTAGELIGWGQDCPTNSTCTGGSILQVPANLRETLRYPRAFLAVARKTIVISSTGDFYQWGDLSYDQLNPQPANFFSNIVKISPRPMEHDEIIALKSDGTAAGWWGTGLAGYAGHREIPLELFPAVDIAQGNIHLGVRADSRLIPWGGATDWNCSWSPRPAELDGAVAIHANTFHSNALTADGRVHDWHCGNPDIPMPVGLNSIIKLFPDNSRNIAMRHDGSRVAWGHGTVDPFSSIGRNLVEAGFRNGLVSEIEPPPVNIPAAPRNLRVN